MDRSAMSNYIPEDCWPEILKQLPVKSLARFRCVCRRWDDLICSSYFIADHLASSKSKPRLFITDVYHKSSEEKSCVIFDSDSSSTATCIPHIMPKGSCSYKLVGSAEGIICFRVHHNQRCEIVLWNPVINKYIELPDEAHTRSTSNSVLMSTAIGVKPSEEDDLRALRVSSNQSGIWRNAAVVVEIYSVRQGEWRVLHTNTPCSRNFLFDSGLKPYVNGDVHWLKVDDAGSYMLIRFGFEKEEFSRINLLGVLARSHPYYLYVAVYCGRLALLQWHLKDSCWKIWTRSGNEEDSWSAIISIDPANFIYGITHDRQILMSRSDYGDNVVLLYNSTSKSFRELDMQEARDGLRACPFVESLVFMDGEGGAVSP